MAKLKPGEKRVQLSFQRPEDLRLFSFIERESYRCRWDVQTFIIASLTEAFADKLEDPEVERLAAEAAQKVRERTAPAPPVTPVPEAPKQPPTISMEEAAREAEAQIAQLDAIAAKTMEKISVRRRAPIPPIPPLPKKT